MNEYWDAGCYVVGDAPAAGVATTALPGDTDAGGKRHAAVN